MPNPPRFEAGRPSGTGGGKETVNRPWAMSRVHTVPMAVPVVSCVLSVPTFSLASVIVSAPHTTNVGSSITTNATVPVPPLNYYLNMILLLIGYSLKCKGFIQSISLPQKSF